MDLNHIDYLNYKEETFDKRYINIDSFYDLLTHKYANYIEKIGESTLKKPIYKLKIGKGKKKILAWTQMHGNETTGTLACLDLLNYLNSESGQDLLKEIELHIILILNPDGAIIWNRRNAVGIDLNRDFIAKQSIEINLLIEQCHKIKPDLALNLHDQRSIFSVGETNVPATLSFLAPAVDFDGSNPPNRQLAMALIGEVYQSFKQLNFNQIARFNHDFYPNSTGDNFQKMGIPTILIEAGHYQEDYQRQVTRQYFCLALISIIHAFTNVISLKNTEIYHSIPNNGEQFYDIILRNTSIKNIITDIAIQYKEIIDNDNLLFKGEIIEVGNLSQKFGHQEYNNLQMEIKDNYLIIGSLAEFKTDKITFVNGDRIKSNS